MYEKEIPRSLHFCYFAVMVAEEALCNSQNTPQHYPEYDHLERLWTTDYNLLWAVEPVLKSGEMYHHGYWS